MVKVSVLLNLIYKCKLKQQEETSRCRREWPTSGTPTASNAGKDVEQLELGGGHYGSCLEDSSMVSHKTKHTFTTQSSNCVP